MADASPLEVAAGGESSKVVVPGYRVERLLRRHSADDAVYLATDVEHGRTVELRVLTGPADGHLRARFESQVVMPASIVHPHLPEVYGSGETSRGVYLATARLEGVTLADMAGRDGLPPQRAVRLLGGVADALDAVHRQGLAHGDVRLEKVVVVERRVEHPYLVDFTLRSDEPSADGSATGAAADVRAFATALSKCLAEVPPGLGMLLAQTAAGDAAGAPRTAGECIGEAARTLVAAPRLAPQAPPARKRRRWRSARVPGMAGLAIVLVAGAAGLLVGRQSGDRADARSAGSAAGVRVSLPDGWRQTAAVPGIGGLDLTGALALAGPSGRPALVAGRLRGLSGSVYPAAVARRVDPRPPAPEAVSLSRYEAIRFAGLRAPNVGRLTLFVAPTSAGTLAAACLPGAPAACEQAAASLELSGADASGVTDGERFARELDRVVGSLDTARSEATRRLRGARLSSEQARAARQVAGAYAAAGRSLRRLSPPPAARAAQGRLTDALASLANGYGRLAVAARRRQEARFAAVRRSLRRDEAALTSLLRRL